jgi:hypothetical protein
MNGICDMCSGTMSWNNGACTCNGVQCTIYTSSSLRSLPTCSGSWTCMNGVCDMCSGSMNWNNGVCTCNGGPCTVCQD